MILGIDIGLTGAIAVLKEDGSLVRIEDMPCLDDGPAGRRKINTHLLADLMMTDLDKAEHAYVERVGPRPAEGAVGGFAFGRSSGVIEMGLDCCGVPYSFLTPAAWKAAIGMKVLPRDDPARRKKMKDAARSMAMDRWPKYTSLFARSRDDGRAEAALIAIAGLIRKGVVL